MELNVNVLRSKTSNSLSFQCLPRHLRRRAASFKLNRLPARLRARGAYEVRIRPWAARSHPTLRTHILCFMG